MAADSGPDDSPPRARSAVRGVLWSATRRSGVPHVVMALGMSYMLVTGV
nr:hypothetical protein [Kibdelosporangium sp. MJ126-NF4]CTQ93535.1 hypothetical protein [Kibdelosporangium sp. MJ126-NF4]